MSHYGCRRGLSLHLQCSIDREGISRRGSDIHVVWLLNYGNVCLKEKNTTRSIDFSEGSEWRVIGISFKGDLDFFSGGFTFYLLVTDYN